MNFAPREMSTGGRTWTVVAEAHTIDGVLILAERYADGGALRLTFATAFVPLDIYAEPCGEWVNGVYFDGSSGPDNRRQARANFLKRVGGYWV